MHEAMLLQMLGTNAIDVRHYPAPSHCECDADVPNERRIMEDWLDVREDLRLGDTGDDGAYFGS